jgi:Ser/Thr protein kinase RdoA (MazF antagonist)
MPTSEDKVPHFMDRVTDTEQWVMDLEVTPELPDADRDLLASTLRRLRKSIGDRSAPEQLLHGEPHPWNVLCTKAGPLFIDFENCARGPVEYDLAWVPQEVSDQYPNADQELVGDCRGLMLAIIAAHRWRRDDEHPSGPQREVWLDTVRRGPPWPALDAV